MAPPAPAQGHVNNCDSSSVNAPRTVKVKIDGGVSTTPSEDAAELSRLAEKKQIMMSATEDLYEEIKRVEENITRRKTFLKKEVEDKLAELKEKTQEESRKQAVVDTEAQLRKKRDFLKNLQGKIHKEQEMQEIGRRQINDDINRHQAVMKKSIEGLKVGAKKERQEFVSAIVREVDSFKLPKANELFGTQNEALIAKMKGLCDECLKF